MRQTPSNWVRFFDLILILITVALCAPLAQAQTRRTAELRSCLSSEFALGIVENIDVKQSDNANHEIGRRVGYVITEYYKKAIWAMDDPETEGRSVVIYAMESAQSRMKYMSRVQLAKDVRDCRLAFGN